MKGWVKKFENATNTLWIKGLTFYLDVLEYSSDKMLPLIYVLMIPVPTLSSLLRCLAETEDRITTRKERIIISLIY